MQTTPTLATPALEETTSASHPAPTQPTAARLSLQAEPQAAVSPQATGTEKRAIIRQLNDAFRTSGGQGGQFVMTRTVAILPTPQLVALVHAVCQFKDFNPQNNPWGENDFGAIHLGPNRFFFKIDYYSIEDPNFASEDPSNPAITKRVLTLMHSSDY